MVTWLPQSLGCIDNQIFFNTYGALLCVLRMRECSTVNEWTQGCRTKTTTTNPLTSMPLPLNRITFHRPLVKFHISFNSFFSRTLMNPLTLKSINLKNINLFGVPDFSSLSQVFFLLLAVRDYLKHLPQWRVWQMRESYHLTSEYVIRLQLYSKLAMFLEIFCTKERWEQSK